MAKQLTEEEIQHNAEKKSIQNDKKQFKKEENERKKEAKRRAKEISKREEALAEEEESNAFLTFLATVIIVFLWLIVVIAIIKLDIGGFGSNVLKPILKDVPVVNKILPGEGFTETKNEESYGGYSSLKDAVDKIENLEYENELLKNSSMAKDSEIEDLKAEVLRLQEFEKLQVDFERIRTSFYEEVVYAEKGPGAEAYAKYYESIDPDTAQFIYRQVAGQKASDNKMKEYAETYSSMKPKTAASIFEAMTDDLDLVAQILSAMDTTDRANIMNAMSADVAAKLTKLMAPSGN